MVNKFLQTQTYGIGKVCRTYCIADLDSGFQSTDSVNLFVALEKAEEKKHWTHKFGTKGTYRNVELLGPLEFLLYE